ncbi:hypothetical protein MXB_3464 [Myxobolus squamalis]|nr:hypothetical protein MXB_3464 [Myxobolus squamalis]
MNSNKYIDSIESPQSELNVFDSKQGVETSQLNKLSNRGETTECLISNKNSLNFGDEDYEQRKWTKLFVGGLPFSSNDFALHKYFSKFGEIFEAVVIRDRITGASKGYGFVTMKEKSSAEMAVLNPYPFIDGRRCNVNYAFLGAKKDSQENRYYYFDASSQYWSYGPPAGFINDSRHQQRREMIYPFPIEPFLPNLPNTLKAPHFYDNFRNTLSIPMEYNFAHSFPNNWHYGVSFAPSPSYGGFMYQYSPPLTKYIASNSNPNKSI